MPQNILPASVLALGIALSGFLIGNGIITFKKLNQVVDVRGLDERIVDSNEASWMMTYVVQGNQLGDVYKRSSDTDKSIKDFLKNLGFKEEEIVMGVLNVQDQYLNNYSNTKPTFRYSGRLTITVASSNVDQIEKAQKMSSELVGKEIQLEANSIRYFFTQLNQVKPDMLKKANESAREAAASFAKDTGADIGNIQRASQGLFTIESPYAFESPETSRKKKLRVVTQVSYYLN